MILEELFTDIADSLRGQSGEVDVIAAEDFANEIEELKVLDTTDATATSDVILEGNTAYVNGAKVEGTMDNLGELNYEPSDLNQAIPDGYTSGGQVKAADITKLQEYKDCLALANAIDTPIDYEEVDTTAEDIREGKIVYINGERIVGTLEELDTSDATATTGDIVEGKTAYVDGEKITGTLVSVDSSDVVKLKHLIEANSEYVSVMGNPIHISDSSSLKCEIYPIGECIQEEGDKSVFTPRLISCVGESGNIYIVVSNNDGDSYTKTLPVQQKMCSIDTFKDRFVYQDDTFYECHEIAVRTLLGDNFVYANAHTNIFVLQSALGDHSLNTHLGLCEYFEPYLDVDETGWTVMPNNSIIIGRTSMNQIIIRCDDYNNDIEGFKTMLNSLQMSIYYPLATPEYLECDEEQVSILSSFTTYDSITHISMGDISDIQVNYKQNFNALYPNFDAYEVI